MSDPVFMARYGYQPEQVHTVFPYDPDECDAKIRAGDKGALRSMALGRGWLQETNSGEFKSWEDLKLLKDNWDGPLILKGIQSVLVRMASCVVSTDFSFNKSPGCREGHRHGCRRDYRLQPWYVCLPTCYIRDTTHNYLSLGGRQLDGALPSIYALEQICKSPKIRDAQASNKLTVLFDSGIRTGSDIIKAMALGAQGILRASFRPCLHS
jgi:hypothetical protein